MTVLVMFCGALCRWPYAPWWELPKAKAITRQYKAQPGQQQVQSAKEQQLEGQPAQCPAGPIAQAAAQ
jgi:hypothetical protein